MNARPRRWAVFLVICAMTLLAAQPSAAATGETDLNVTLNEDKLTVKAENVSLKRILEGIYGAYPLIVRGLESRSDEVIDFTAKDQPPEKMFKRLLRQLGETNYAFEFKGERLSRISVMPEAKGKASSPRPPSASVQPGEDQVPVVRVDRVIDGSQAQELGIQSGDLVIEYDGVKVTDPGELIREVKQKSDSPSVGMTLLRDGAPFRLNLAGGFIGIHIVPHKAPRETVAGYLD